MARRSSRPDIRELLFPSVVAAERQLESIANLEPDIDDRLWRAKLFKTVPKEFAFAMAKEYEIRYVFDGQKAANLYLLDHRERIEVLPSPLSSNESDIEAQAKRIASENRQRAWLYSDNDKLAVELWRSAKRLGVRPPSPENPQITISGAIKRLCADEWWRHALCLVHGRNLEATAIRLGLVHSHASAYVSNVTVERRRNQKRRNRRILEAMVAVNELGDQVSLMELAEASVSNPRIRRCELMARMAGFEQIAQDLGHVGEFYSLTALPACTPGYPKMVRSTQPMTAPCPTWRKNISARYGPGYGQSSNGLASRSMDSGSSNRNTTAPRTGICCFSWRENMQQRCGPSCGTMLWRGMEPSPAP